MPEYAGKIELETNFGMFSAEVPHHIKRVASYTTTKVDCDNWPVEEHHAYKVAKEHERRASPLAAPRRQQNRLRMGAGACRGILHTRKVRATNTDIFYAVARDPNTRFQVVHRPVGVGGIEKPYNYIIRATQGHGGSIQRQMLNVCAHTLIRDARDAPICIPATKASLLAGILGPFGQGLVPGGTCRRGNEKEGQRGHVHCGASEPEGLVSGSCAPMMFRDYVQLYQPTTGVFLIPQIIDTKYFLWVNTMPDKDGVLRGKAAARRLRLGSSIDFRNGGIITGSKTRASILLSATNVGVAGGSVHSCASIDGNL